MAGTSVLKLKVDGNEYDAGLKKAQQGLQALEKSLQEAGKSFSDVDGKVLEYTKALGKMDTVSTSTKGKINEMSKAFVELSMQYKKLSDNEKNSPFGVALAKSLEELRTRVVDSKRDLHDVESQLGNVGTEGKETGGVLDTLASRFTLNIDALKLFEFGLSSVNSALAVAKDAFFKNEENLDEWGRTVKSCESLYSGFLVSLNTGDIGGYLSNIDDIVNAARAAYDALDELSTFNAFNQVNRTKAQASFQDAVNAFRSDPSMRNRAMLNAKFSSYRENLATRQELERAAYEAEIVSVANDHGISAKDLQDALSGSWGNYKSLKALKPSKKVTEANGFSGIYGGGAMLFGNSSSTRFVPANDAERLGQALRQLNDTELQYLQSLGAAANSTGIEITNIEKQMLRVTRTGSGGGGGGGKTGGGGGRVSKAVAEMFPVGSIAALNNEMQELRKEQNLVTNSDDWTEYQRKIFGVKEEIKALRGEITPRDFGAISLMGLGTDKVAAAQESFRKQKLDVKPVEKTEVKLNEQMGQMVGGINSMVSGIEGLGIELPKGLHDVLGGIQAITTILMAIETMQKVGTILGFIPHHTGGVVRAAGGYRVPGNYGYDAVPAILTSGETVLTRAQAGNLASQLAERNSGMVMQPFVEGEKIFLGMNNTSKRMGRGEIVTTSMLRQYGLLN